MDKEEAMKILKDFHDKSALFSVRTALHTIIPELNKSEDNMIKEELIKHLKDGVEGYMPAGDSEDYARWLAWLEKQGYTKKDVDDAYLKGICDTKHELEKQGEQKTADKMQVSEKLYEHIRNTCACIDDALSSETLADIKDYLEMANKDAQSAFDMIEKQGEQKPYGQRKECLDCQFNYAGECKGFCQMKRDEQKPKRMISSEAKEALYDKPTDEEMKELLRTEYEKGRADAYCEMKAYAYKREWREEDEKKTNELLALERKACITKTIEWFFIQLNEGDMECRDIEKFVANYKEYMEE